MSPLFNPAEAVTVSADTDGQPQRFRWNGRQHIVVTVVNHWRVDTDWWLQPQQRDSYLVVTDTGLLAVIYRDALTRTWHVQQVYD